MKQLSIALIGLSFFDCASISSAQAGEKPEIISNSQWLPGRGLVSKAPTATGVANSIVLEESEDTSFLMAYADIAPQPLAIGDRVAVVWKISLLSESELKPESLRIGLGDAASAVVIMPPLVPGTNPVFAVSMQRPNILAGANMVRFSSSDLLSRLAPNESVEVTTTIQRTGESQCRVSLQYQGEKAEVVLDSSSELLDLRSGNELSMPSEISRLYIGTGRDPLHLRVDEVTVFKGKIKQ